MNTNNAPERIELPNGYYLEKHKDKHLTYILHESDSGLREIGKMFYGMDNPIPDDFAAAMQPQVSESDKILYEIRAMLEPFDKGPGNPNTTWALVKQVTEELGKHRQPAAVSADAVEFERLREEFQIVANLGAKADVESAMLVAKAYGDACRLDGARKGIEAAAKYIDDNCDIESWQNLIDSIRALSPETVCGGE